MTTIHRLESATNDPTHGGVLVTFDCGIVKSVVWKSSIAVDVRELAKKCTEDLIDSLLKAHDDKSEIALRETNWVSMVAGIAKHVSDFNQSVARAATRELVRSVQ